MTGSRHLRLRLFDKIIVVYCIAMILLLLGVGRPFGAYVDELLAYLTVTVIVVLIVKYTEGSRSKLLSALRWLYPVILYTFLYRLTGGTMRLLFDTFQDASLTAFELSLLGVNPTLYIDRHLLNPIVNEMLSATYFLYYPIIPVFAVWLYLRRDLAILSSALVSIQITFFISYALFFLYPVEGPRWFFADLYQNDIDGYLFREAVNLVQAKAAVRGGCMPSSHTAVALVIWMYCLKYYRRASWWILPVLVGISIGTFWGRFHYISDVVVGIAIGTLTTFAVWKWYRPEEDKVPTPATSQSTRVQHAQ